MSAPDSPAHRRAVDKYMARQLAAGKCRQCGQPRQAGSLARCADCLARNRARYVGATVFRALGEGRRPWGCGRGPAWPRRVSLQALYRIHDELEAALRLAEVTASREVMRMRHRIWAAHDELERVIVKEEASRAGR